MVLRWGPIGVRRGGSSMWRYQSVVVATAKKLCGVDLKKLKLLLLDSCESKVDSIDLCDSAIGRCHGAARRTADAHWRRSVKRDLRSELQSFRVSELQSFRASELQSFRASD